jgi:hypothetical protein
MPPPPAPQNFYPQSVPGQLSSRTSSFPRTALLYRINSLEILNGADRGGVPNAGIEGFCCVNGVFATGAASVGPTLVKGQQPGVGLKPEVAYAKDSYRGAVAITHDNKVMVRRFVNDPSNDKINAKGVTTNYGVLGDAEKIFGRGVKHFMGGGLMLINDAKNVIDLNKGDQDRDTLRIASHICLGNDNLGNAYFVICFNLDLRMLVPMLINKGLRYLCCFDGSQAFWVRKRDGLTRMCVDGEARYVGRQPDGKERNLDPVSYCFKASGAEAGWIPLTPPLVTARPTSLDFWNRKNAVERCFVWLNG